MHLLLGNSRVKKGNYDGAIRSFERARALLRPHTSRALSMISLVSFPTTILQPIEIDRGARYLDGNLMILTLRSVSVFVKPCMPRVGGTRQASLY